MPKPLDDYDNLNENGCMNFALDIDRLADQIVGMNYGTIRFIAALARARRRSAKIKEAVVEPCGKDELADILETMIKDGVH